MSERQMALASRKPQAPTYLASRPSADWQDVVVQCSDGPLGRVQSWKNGWVRCTDPFTLGSLVGCVCACVHLGACVHRHVSLCVGVYVGACVHLGACAPVDLALFTSVYRCVDVVFFLFAPCLRRGCV